jgi:hypothetical protein
MKKFRIELSEEQMIIVARCLEDISRFAAGQSQLQFTIENMLLELPPSDRYKIRNKVTDILRYEVKKHLFPSSHIHKYLDYDSTNFIGNTYQIYRTILHHLAISNETNSVYTSPTLPSGNLGSIKIEEIREEENVVNKYKQNTIVNLTTDEDSRSFYGENGF